MVDGCPPDARRSHVEWLRYVHCVLALAMFAVLSCPSPTFPWSFTLSGICCRALNTGSRFMDAPAMDVAHYHGDGTIITRCHLRGFEGWCLAHPPTPVLTLNKPSPCNVSRYRLWSQPATWAEGFGGCASVLIPICLEFHTRISCVTSNYLEGLHPSSSRPLWIWCA